ncbi:hypothetical protein GWI33_017192 [Rhynchophorus ferrugineus]|uniref:Uncharacterized protein n=1 Tax=Rhynchophorus ferrugineus TaxID=354439 RepID=A0A834M469_RHYFE|nr:hypothetical protein GWI33_017192 [Rhynchophorus ferrugineus]
MHVFKLIFLLLAIIAAVFAHKKEHSGEHYHKPHKHHEKHHVEHHEHHKEHHSIIPKHPKSIIEKVIVESKPQCNLIQCVELIGSLVKNPLCAPPPPAPDC